MYICTHQCLYGFLDKLYPGMELIGKQLLVVSFKKLPYFWTITRSCMVWGNKHWFLSIQIGGIFYKILVYCILGPRCGPSLASIMVTLLVAGWATWFSYCDSRFIAWCMAIVTSFLHSINLIWYLPFARVQT